MRGKRGPRGWIPSFPSCCSRVPAPRRDARGTLARPAFRPRHPSAARRPRRISNHVVRTMSAYTGRGPTKARGLSQRRRRDRRAARHADQGGAQPRWRRPRELVLTMRKAFQGTVRHDLIDGVEEILGRKVTAFMSDNHIDPDVAVEVFCSRPQRRGPGRRRPRCQDAARGDRWRWRWPLIIFVRSGARVERDPRALGCARRARSRPAESSARMGCAQPARLSGVNAAAPRAVHASDARSSVGVEPDAGAEPPQAGRRDQTLPSGRIAERQLDDGASQHALRTQDQQSPSTPRASR